MKWLFQITAPVILNTRYAMIKNYCIYFKSMFDVTPRCFPEYVRCCLLPPGFFLIWSFIPKSNINIDSVIRPFLLLYLFSLCDNMYVYLHACMKICIFVYYLCMFLLYQVIWLMWIKWIWTWNTLLFLKNDFGTNSIILVSAV